MKRKKIRKMKIKSRKSKCIQTYRMENMKRKGIQGIEKGSKIKNKVGNKFEIEMDVKDKLQRTQKTIVKPPSIKSVLKQRPTY